MKADIRRDRARQKLLDAFQAGRTLTYWDACDLLFLTRNNQNRRHINALHADGLIHICRWQCLPATRPTPVFAIGKRCDAPKPETRSRSDINRIAAERRVEKLGIEAKRAIDRARKAGANALVVAGMTIWRRGEGVNFVAARAAFGQPI